MRKRIDLVGKRFNKLKVVEYAFTKKCIAWWRCVCDCGKEKNVTSQRLREGITQSCGCIGKHSSIEDVMEKNIRQEGDCLIWTGAKTPYGTFTFRGKSYPAHRVAYELEYGKIPKGSFICHKCDNPSCCNPEHLYAGNAKTNAQDEIKFGKTFRGEKNAKSKLSNEDVLKIRHLHEVEGVKQADLARRFNVSQTNILSIIKRTIWSHI